jgi:hypothetical protein
MKNWVSLIWLGCFVIMLGLSASSLSTVGGYWPQYAVASLFAIAPLIRGSRRYRIAAMCAVGLSCFLVIHDYEAGRVRKAEIEKWIRSHSTPNHSTDPTLSSGTPPAGQESRHP